MENLSHTLLGLSLAKAGLERATPLATTTLVISSNLPDIDVVVRLGGGTLAYLEHHRGLTHSFFGIIALAALLTLVLVYLDRKLRLRRDPFRRPIRPARIFLLALAGGYGHLFMDFTNNYGVRPFLPFDRSWNYGDIVFVVDPWIWLILGSAAVWLTTTTSARVLFWLVIGVITSLLMLFALGEPSENFPVTVPFAARVVWFVGVVIIAGGALLGWYRAGAPLARYALLLLAIYYCGMWMAHQSALERARESLPVDATTSIAAWPAPANPAVWHAVATTNDHIYTRYVGLITDQSTWRERAVIPPEMIAALRQSETARTFLDFTRYTAATVTEREGGYSIVLHDIRFGLRLYGELSRDLAVESVRLSGF